MPSDKQQERLALADLRNRLAGADAPTYWRSLEELAGSEEFEGFLKAEFPSEADTWSTALGRREFLKLMGASIALAGLGACTRQPTEKIFPYAKAPEEVVPGKPLTFATSLVTGGFAHGVLVESHEGRPTKIEGNPEHPASLGAASALSQAAVLGLYDPDRSRVITSLGEIRPWSAFSSALESAMRAQKGTGGAGLRLLTGAITSPTLAAQIATLLEAYPQAKWHQYEALARDNSREGTNTAFGRDLDPVYRLERARTVVSLDADLFGNGPAAVRHTKDWTSTRRLGDEVGRMGRLYAVEASPTITGGYADHRLAARPSHVESLAFALAFALGLPVEPAALTDDERKWITAAAEDLRANPGASLVVAGEAQPASVHVVVHAINDQLGNAGKTVAYVHPAEPVPARHMASIGELARDMQAGSVDVLVMSGVNPVYDAPADAAFAESMKKVALRIHHGLYQDETAELCHWHVAGTHELESWSDARAFDGTVSLVQPLIAPLFDGKTAHEILGAMLGGDESAYDIVRNAWSRLRGDAGFEAFWRRALHDGTVADSAHSPSGSRVRPDWARSAAQLRNAPRATAEGTIEIAFRADASALDGRFANNGWLQELPRPLTKIAWDNAALIAPSTAERFSLATGDMVSLEHQGHAVEVPVWVQPGHPRDSATLHLGYGRRRAGKVGNGVGFDVYPLRSAANPWTLSGVSLTKTGRSHTLATTQNHHSMEGRHLVRSATLETYKHDPGFAAHYDHGPKGDTSMYPPHPYDGHAWGMVIDLAACTGCNACVVACRSENNIPIVGKDQITRGRDLDWIRIDRYFEGPLDDPEVHHQPVTCMHCENAPCETVCPVAATVHSSEGLNEMVYNRCVGTRYCANNCPYKVRRFNFYLYADWSTETFKLQRNPDVSVRSRGVMEKCTYCVQRINEKRIAAKLEDRAIADGEIKTACQQSCPADAIVFGDINDPDSRVAKARKDSRQYGLLTELNTKPRTTYLAAVKNPHPSLAPKKKHGGGHEGGHA